VIWHDIDIDAEFHIHLVHFAKALSSCGCPGHKDFIHGNMNAIPAIAAYESWNPTDCTDDGDIASCTTREVMRTDPVL